MYLCSLRYFYLKSNVGTFQCFIKFWLCIMCLVITLKKESAGFMFFLELN